MVVKVEKKQMPRDYVPQSFIIDLQDVLMGFLARNFICRELEHRACHGLGEMYIGAGAEGGAGGGGGGAGMQGQEHDEYYSRDKQ